MRIETVGEGEPEIAVVGGIHGDEPCGIRGVERVLADDLAVDRPVAFVVANERAHERDVRYVDEDLNRAFPGDPDGASHESRLAHRLSQVVADCQTLSLHSTQSYGRPFALVDEVSQYEREICPALSVETVVETSAFREGRLFDVADRLIEIECGYQGTDAAADNAEALIREFLTATGVFPGEVNRSEMPLPVYRLTEPVPKSPAEAYQVEASNFAEVDVGETYAVADERHYVADEAFYPVLMSPYGYEDVFGYAADRVGTL